ncbi:Fur family transcriptional regulator, iron response regulator [Devosia enhydra]|uniref:Ferric uptake regulation protein n=1 Tax=Devosia enhydra TaxID=665118 RepID=A0A1K2I3C1_9HYPH|nr:Fur family transcriptional regulator [Devosia enhydra]SFZ86841.1 Fur family transcriptional regulator, iron response regulator [Devosia enhydra]
MTAKASLRDHPAPAASGAEPSRRACLATILRMAGLRATRQRMDLADRLVGRDRHVTAETLYLEASAAGEDLSLATVYNTLRQFQGAGLVREIAVEGLRSVFDTDTSRHHHFYFADEDRIIDIPPGHLLVPDLPEGPEGYEVDRLDIIVRLRRPSR